MFSRALLPTLLLFFTLGFATGCGGARSEAKSEPKTVDDFFPIKIGDRTVRMQVAALPAEVQRGLMQRKSLGADEGMLFIFMRPQPLGFWMRNTTIPLDIGYIAPNGELREIYALHPLDEKTVQSRGRDLQFALEMNQGWFQRNGVKPGAKLDLKAVADALRARGLKPEAAGLR
jgi:uncharacterized membrane protein (UPF0127 family)